MKVKIRKSWFSDFILAYSFAAATIFLFYKANNIKNGTYMLALFSAMVKTFVMVEVLGMIEKSVKKQHISGATVFLLVSILYNQNSILKYAVDCLYDGSIDNNALRLIGDIYVSVIIFIGVLVWKKVHKANKEFNLLENERFMPEFKINKLLLWMILFAYLIVQAYFLIKQNTLVTNAGSRSLNTVFSALEYICFALVVINVKKVNGKYVLSSFVPICVLGIFLVLATVILGTKQVIIRPAIVIACGLVYQNKLSIKKMKYFIYASPLLLQGITNLSELVSGRFSEYPALWVLRYHVFRYDLSDLAMTFAVHFSKSLYKWGVVKEAFCYSLPKFLYDKKLDVLPMYNANVKSIGLEGYPMDYNDTVFSFGAQIGGGIGILLAFILIVLFHEWISRKIVRINKMGSIILMVLFGYFSYVESDLFMFFYLTRDTVVYLILAGLLLKIILRRKKEKRTKIYG